MTFAVFKADAKYNVAIEVIDRDATTSSDEQE